MTRKSVANDFIILPKDSRDLRAGDVVISEKEQQDLILHAKVFEKLIDASIYKYRVEIANMKFVGKEQKAYDSIAALMELKTSMKNTEKNYKAHLEEQEKIKEAKKK